MISLEYAAGFFDGEGCVNFSRCRGTIFPRVLVVNTDMSVLLAFKERFGGDIQPLSGRRANWKQAYTWRLSWRPAVEFCSAVLPYLRVKQRQAEAVLEWARLAPGKGHKWDAEKRSEILAFVARQNRKGA